MSLGVCDRCNLYFNHKELRPDGMYPNLMVCRKCWDRKHPAQTPIKMPSTELQPVKNARPLTADGDYVGPTTTWNTYYHDWNYKSELDESLMDKWNDVT